MQAGKLRDRVTFQRQASETDDYGNVRGAFENLPNGTVWADVRETPGKERVEAGAVEAMRTATIRVRHSSFTAGITPADRVVARGEIWNIRSATLIGRRPEIVEFLCETGVAT